MKTYTLFELQQFEAYPILKNILNEAEIQVFFNTPEGQRGALIPNKVVRRVTPPTAKVTPTPIVIFTPIVTEKKLPTIIRGTQKCTDVSIENIRAMALDYMGRDFEYRGTSYNLNELGWTFEFSNKKNALGTCISSRWSGRGRIQLSQWIITNSEEKYDKWVNTMLHEIAHAIDVTIRGKSSHDWQWQSIARTIGCDAKRTTSVEFADLLKNPISKYTMVCPNGHTTPSHKRRVSHRKNACTTCCDDLNGGRFSSEYVLEQIQNW